MPLNSLENDVVALEASDRLIDIIGNVYLWMYTAQKNKGNTKITHPRSE